MLLACRLMLSHGRDRRAGPGRLDGTGILLQPATRLASSSSAPVNGWSNDRVEVTTAGPRTL